MPSDGTSPNHSDAVKNWRMSRRMTSKTDSPVHSFSLVIRSASLVRSCCWGRRERKIYNHHVLLILGTGHLLRGGEGATKREGGGVEKVLAML